MNFDSSNYAKVIDEFSLQSKDYTTGSLATQNIFMFAKEY